MNSKISKASSQILSGETSYWEKHVFKTEMRSYMKDKFSAKHVIYFSYCYNG